MSARVAIGRLDDLVDGEATRVDVDGHRLAVVRLGDDVYVIGDRCTHAEASLSDGEVDVETKHLECWRHGSSFSLETGHPDVPPATKPVPVYDVENVDGELFATLRVESQEAGRV